MGQNICKWCNWQGIDLQNKQLVHLYVKKKTLNLKMKI